MNSLQVGIVILLIAILIILLKYILKKLVSLFSGVPVTSNVQTSSVTNDNRGARDIFTIEVNNYDEKKDPPPSYDSLFPATTSQDWLTKILTNSIMVSSGHDHVLCIELYFMIPGVTELSPLKTKMLHYMDAQMYVWNLCINIDISLEFVERRISFLWLTYYGINDLISAISWMIKVQKLLCT